MLTQIVLQITLLCTFTAMITSPRKSILIVLLLLIFNIASDGQAGVHIHGGLLSGQNGLESLTPEGQHHYGYRIGLDARLNDGSMYFLPGVHYMQISFNASDKAEYFKADPAIKVIKGRFGLGFTFIEIPSKFKLRSRVQAAVNYINNVIDANQFPAGVERLNDAYASVDLGLGVDLLFFTIDIAYEKGVVNAVYKEANSKFDFYHFTVGVFF